MDVVSVVMECGEVLFPLMCMCVGYRPILDAMTSFKVEKETEQGVVDIEVSLCQFNTYFIYLNTNFLPLLQDIRKKLCPRTGKTCTNPKSTCVGPSLGSSWEVVSPSVWYAPSSLVDLFSIFSTHPESSVRLVAGDTGRGKLAESI